ncbi:iron-siderophore ABC transporter substrate-binding protein, partial [Mycobacterium avium subsp. hominissuis]|nr:iron-siderophore ABC transporter substrate-binding protein [Mycobacterium avium subsp. hominissuis]
MLFGVIRPARLAAVTAALVVACGGCGSDRPAATTTRSLVTPTTQIAG